MATRGNTNHRGRRTGALTGWRAPARLVLVGLLVAAPRAPAQSVWHPEFTPVTGDVRAANAPLEIVIDAALPAAELDSLALEIDGLDHSAILEVDHGAARTTLTVAPPEPLVAGPHDLRLLLYSADGEIIERGSWRFLVAESRGFALAGARLPTNIEVGYRLDSDDPDYDGDRLVADGSASLDASGRAGSWQLAANGDLLLQTDHDEIAAELATEELDDAFALEARHDIELGEYLFRGDRPGLEALVGHHALDGSSLLVSDFNRRGASVNGNAGDGRLQGSVFAFRTEPILGWNNGLGVGDDANRVLGAMASLHPFASNPERLSLQVMGLRGEGSASDGIGIGGEGPPGSGDGIALAVESRLADDRFRIRGEIARSDFDADASDGVDEERSDDAGSLLAEVIPWRDAAGGRSVSLGAEYQQVGRDFRSLANPTLPNDREMRRVFAGLDAGAWTLRAQFARENDNVDGDAELPGLENRIREFLVSWSPLRAEEALPWYGRPAVTAGVRRTRTTGEAPEDPLLALLGQGGETIIDSETPYYHADVSLQHDRWGVNFGFAQGDEENLLSGSNAAGSRSQSAGFHWIPGERLFLFGQWQQDRFDSGPGLPVLDTDLFMLNAEIGLLPGRLSLLVDASLNRNATDDDFLDEETRTWGLGLDWQPGHPAWQRRGATLWIRAEEQQVRDHQDAAGDFDTWQVMAGIRLSLFGG